MCIYIIYFHIYIDLSGRRPFFKVLSGGGRVHGHDRTCKITCAVVYIYIIVYNCICIEYTHVYYIIMLYRIVLYPYVLLRRYTHAYRISLPYTHIYTYIHIYAYTDFKV